MSPGRVRRRSWTKRGPTGHQVKVTSWGFTVQVNGKQQRRFNADWTKEDAQDALASFLLDKNQRKAKPITLADAAARYEQAKARKRTVGEDKKTLKRLMAHFGRETKLDKLTADVISQYRDQRFAAGSKNRKGEDGKPRPLTAAAVNRELALIRHLLNLAHEEWGALAAVPGWTTVPAGLSPRNQPRARSRASSAHNQPITHFRGVPIRRNSPI